MRKTIKSFENLKKDYDFFQRHSTELQVVSRAMAVALRGVGSPQHPKQLLDFGSGNGHFLEELLKTAAVTPKSWSITIIDPVAEYRKRAVRRLAPWSKKPVQSWSELPRFQIAQFDRIIVNHVLYYVPDLAKTLNALWEMTANDGNISITLGHDTENIAVAFWEAMFRTIRKPVPYNFSSGVERYLNRQQWPYRKQKICSQLIFADTIRNRRSLARLTFGKEHLSLFDPRAIEGYLNTYSKSGTIQMQLVDELYRVEKS